MCFLTLKSHVPKKKLSNESKTLFHASYQKFCHICKKFTFLIRETVKYQEIESFSCLRHASVHPKTDHCFKK